MSVVPKDDYLIKDGNETGGTRVSEDDDFQMILDHIQDCPALFQSQQIGDPDLTKSDKRCIAEKILMEKPIHFLFKFGKFLKRDHLNFFLKKYHESDEVAFHIENLQKSLGETNQKRIKKNRRYEAMKRLEANGSYFSETEMAKREPLLYYEMVGQYLSDEEKLKKHRDAMANLIPTFSDFLLSKLEKDELNELIAQQQTEENEFSMPDCDLPEQPGKGRNLNKKWGLDWEDENLMKKVKNVCQKQKKLSTEEKTLLLHEFKSAIQNKFINGQDGDFDYSVVDSNSDYDCLDILNRDEEEKYFDEETCDESICTDTGVEDY